MTRKTRRSKAGGDDVAKPEPEGAPVTAETTSSEKPAAETAAAKEPTAEPAPAEAKKVTLPAFGFASDLLSKPNAESTSPESTAPESTADDAAPVPAPRVDAADPRRIFAFADGLERGVAAEPEAAPVRLETWVAFSLAGEVFALPVAPIREVVRVASITRVPHAPKPIRGVTNRRGRVIPVIDLRMRIELPPTELTRGSRVIVVSSRRRLLGLLVDAVHQVIHIDLEQVQPPPDDVMTVQSDYLSGVYHLDDQLILLLDIDRALIIHDAVPDVAGDAAEEPETTVDTSA